MRGSGPHRRRQRSQRPLLGGCLLTSCSCKRMAFSSDRGIKVTYLAGDTVHTRVSRRSSQGHACCIVPSDREKLCGESNFELANPTGRVKTRCHALRVTRIRLRTEAAKGQPREPCHQNGAHIRVRHDKTSVAAADALIQAAAASSQSAPSLSPVVRAPDGAACLYCNLSLTLRPKSLCVECRERHVLCQSNPLPRGQGKGRDIRQAASAWLAVCKNKLELGPEVRGGVDAQGVKWSRCSCERTLF